MNTISWRAFRQSSEFTQGLYVATEMSYLIEFQGRSAFLIIGKIRVVPIPKTPVALNLSFYKCLIINGLMTQQESESMAIQLPGNAVGSGSKLDRG